MKIGVDIDSVVCELMPALLCRVNIKYGTAIKYEDIMEWNWKFTTPDGAIHDGYAEIHEAMRDKEFALALPVVDGAFEGVRELMDMVPFGNVVYITSRGLDVQQTTEKWLRDRMTKSCLEKPKVIFTQLNKNGHDLDVLIDDNIDTALSFAKSGGMAILYRRPWSNDSDKIHELIKYDGWVADCWVDVIRAVRNRLRGKYASLGSDVGRLVDRKQAAYGDSMSKVPELAKVLYPDGFYPEEYEDAIAVIRILDKLSRISQNYDSFNEDSWKDIAGYGLLITQKKKEMEK